MSKKETHAPVHATHKAHTAKEETPVAEEVTEICIKDKTFSPKSFDAKVNEPVVWKNEGKDTHCVTFTPESADIPGCVAPPSSGDIPPGGSYSYTFTVPGSYEYTCGHHKGMVGTVNVT